MKENKEHERKEMEAIRDGDKGPMEIIPDTATQAVRYAMAKGASVEELEKLLTLQERWEKIEARKAFHVAMAAFKANPPKINKDRKVAYSTSKGNVGYSHASLYNVTEKISSELSKHGLSASWIPKQEGGSIFITCKITHSKGHSEEATLSAPADDSGSKNKIQAIGSTAKYLERYTLLALTGLATFDDDDGNAANGAVEYIDEKQLNQLHDLIQVKNSTIDKFCKAFKVNDVKELPKTDFPRALLALNSKKEGKKAGSK